MTTLAVLIVMTDAPDQLAPAIEGTGAEVRAMATGVDAGLGTGHALITAHRAPDMEPATAAEILSYVADRFREPADD